MHAVIVGTGGIGTAVARRLLLDGATVTATYHRHRPAEFDAVQLDATSPAAVARVFGEIGDFDTCSAR